MNSSFAHHCVTFRSEWNIQLLIFFSDLIITWAANYHTHTSHVLDSKCSYLHSVLSSKYGSGEDFLIWPKTGNLEELFKVNSGHNLFRIVNGRCVEDPKSMASALTCNSLPTLDIATN
ncbi:hypothetical protein Hanom_Chr00s000003g01605671 [Helianthus anomalus]